MLKVPHMDSCHIKTNRIKCVNVPQVSVAEDLFYLQSMNACQYNMIIQNTSKTSSKSLECFNGFNDIHTGWSLQVTVGADMTFKFLKIRSKHAVEVNQNMQPTTNYMTLMKSNRQRGAVNDMCKTCKFRRPS